MAPKGYLAKCEPGQKVPDPLTTRRSAVKRLLVFLIPLLLATPAFAGTVYVPYATGVVLGGVTYDTQVWVANDDRAEASTIEYLFLPTFRNGTDRENMVPTEWAVEPGATAILTVEGTRGMLEIYAPENVQIHARMVAVDSNVEDQGFSVPIVSSDTVVPASEEAHLLGWERFDNGETSSTNFALLNLGHEAANCLIDVVRVNGTQAVDDFALTINPLSHNTWPQALGILGVDNASDWRAIVNCDQPFYTYASIYYPHTSQMTFIRPSASGKSQLLRPTDGGVSDEFVYMSDLPIDRWGGIELRPFVNRTGIDWHASGGPVGGIAPIKINGQTYDKGLSFYQKWSSTGFVEYRLNGQYGLFTATVRVADYYRGKYEWAVVRESDGRWLRLERPPEGFRGPERSNPIRISSALTFQVLGDGEVLYRSPEIYSYGDAVVLEIDVTGVDVLRLQTHPGGHERRGAPHRNGLSRDRLVTNCPWNDMPSFADPKLFKLR